MAGATGCDAIATGLWSETSTWNCGTASGVPEADTDVNIEVGTVTLDVDATVGSIYVDNGATLAVANTASGLTLLWGLLESDFSAGNIDLLGDLIIGGINNATSITLGQVNGAFGLVVSSPNNITLMSDVGGVVPLSQLTLISPSLIEVSGNISTIGTQDYLAPLKINTSTTLAASTVTFEQNVFSAQSSPNEADLTVNGNAVFQTNLDDVGPLGVVSLLNNLQVANMTSTAATVSSITTSGSQNYLDGLSINANFIATSINSDINLLGSGGEHDLVLDAAGNILLRNTIGSPRHHSLTVTAGGLILASGNSASPKIFLGGSNPTVFNGNIRFGASGLMEVDQNGSGDIIFNGDLTTRSGGPKTLTINDVSGQTIFNGNVMLGEITTNDGPGDDVTVINGSSFATDQDGSNSGHMTFNDPVRIATNTTIAEIDSGRITFNNTLDAADGLTDIELTIASDADVNIGAIGSLQTFSRFNTDAGGSTRVQGQVGAELDITFNDDVVLTEATVVSAEDISFQGSINTQTFDLRLNAINAVVNGVISGSGNLNSSTDEELFLNAENTYTGQTNLINGTLDLSNALSNNNISSSPKIILNTDAAIRPSGSGFVLNNGQQLTGSGQILGNLKTAAGSNLSPGFSPGIITGGFALQMETGSTLVIEVGGVNAGIDSDLVVFSNLDFNTNLDLGADLQVISTEFLALNDEIMIAENTGINSIPSVIQFNGLPEGATIVGEGLAQEYAISYVGGDGNDVVLTVTSDCLNAITVTGSGDSGPGTLRQAVTDLCDGGVISFEADLMVTLATELVIDKTVAINGNGFAVSLSGDNSTRLFNIAPAGELTLLSLTVQDGYSTSSGGGIYNGGEMTVIDSTFAGNVSDDLLASGGAIYTAALGSTTLQDSTFIGNDGAIGGAIYLENDAASGALEAVNSTFTQNGSNSVQGGAIYNAGMLGSINNTFAANGNATTQGGNLYTDNGSVILFNTLMADASSGDDCFINLGNSNQTVISSLIESGNCDATLTDDPQLRALADNGGHTLTMLPELTSPVIDAGSELLCPAVDQLGVNRPQFGACDIGAIETQYLALIHV
ncbi:MAG: choice-of-anchor Q domain-containing protein, partial [Marinicella sp.]